MLAEQEFEHSASRIPPWLLLQGHVWIPHLMALNGGLWPEVQAKQTPFSPILPYDLPHISYSRRMKSQHPRFNIFFPLILLYQAYPATWIWKIIAWPIGYSYNLCVEVSDNKPKEQWLLNVLIFWDIFIPSGGAYLATETIFQVYEVLLMWTLNILESPCSFLPPESGLVSFW